MSQVLELSGETTLKDLYDLLTVGLMQWPVWGHDLDSKTGKISIKRFGTGR